MQIKTKANGVVEIDDRQLIRFPSGLFGFETLGSFALLDASQQPFYWLQSCEVEQVAFVLIKPTIFRPDYKPAVTSSDLEALELESDEDEDALIFSIVTFQEGDTMTANLQGPVIINRQNGIGRQCISTDGRWQTRHNIADEMAASRTDAC